MATQRFVYFRDLLGVTTSQRVRMPERITQEAWLAEWHRDWFAPEGSEGMTPDEYDALLVAWMAIELTTSRDPDVYAEYTVDSHT